MDEKGPAHVVPILMEVDDGERLSRALRRERRQKHPHYEEMCRRFLADQADFSEEKIQAAGIRRRFSNASIAICKEEVRRFIAGTEHPAGHLNGGQQHKKEKTEQNSSALAFNRTKYKNRKYRKGGQHG